MALIVLVFLAMLLVTFVLIIALTRQSPGEKSFDHRLQSIQVPIHGPRGGTQDTAEWLRKRDDGLGSLAIVLRHFPAAFRLQVFLAQAGSPTTVSNLLLISLSLALTGYSIAWMFAHVFLLDILAAAVLAFVPYAFFSFKRSRRIDAFNAVLADTIDMMGRALRAGYSMPGAIEMLASNAPEPAAAEFGEVFKQQNLGMPLRDALMQILDRFPSLDLRVLVTAILVQKDTGGNLAEILDRTVFVIRERLRIQGEIRVQTAQGRLTGWILTALPVVMLVLLNLVNPGYSSVLVHDPFGRKLAYVSLGMLVMGGFIIRRIVNGIEA